MLQSSSSNYVYSFVLKMQVNPDPDILIFRSGYPDPDPYF